MRERVGMLVGASLALLLAASSSFADEPASNTGEVCIAAFKVSTTGELSMDLPGPGRDSKYSFRFDKKLSVTVAEGQKRRVEALSSAHRLLVEVRLDGERTEAYWLDLRDHDRQRACLWLYEGYWHWTVISWDDRARGCTCWDEAAE